MKKLLLALLLSMTVFVSASETKTEKAKAQTNCPIRGGAIDKVSFSDYKSQRIYYCCQGCDKTFLKAPDEYISEMNAKGINLAKIQTTCPVSGEEVSTGNDFYKSKQGEVAVCCKKCLKKITANPIPYIQKLKKQGVTIGVIAQKNHEGHDHSGHDHHGHDH